MRFVPPRSRWPWTRSARYPRPRINVLRAILGRQSRQDCCSGFEGWLLLFRAYSQRASHVPFERLVCSDCVALASPVEGEARTVSQGPGDPTGNGDQAAVPFSPDRSTRITCSSQPQSGSRIREAVAMLTIEQARPPLWRVLRWGRWGSGGRGGYPQLGFITCCDKLMIQVVAIVLINDYLSFG